MNAFAGAGMKISCRSTSGGQGLEADQMHLDAVAVTVIDRAMDERADVEVAAEFAVDPMQHIEIEARSDACGVVIGIIRVCVRPLSRSTPITILAPLPKIASRALQEPCRPASARNCQASSPGKKPTFGMSRTASGSSNGAVKSAVTG